MRTEVIRTYGNDAHTLSTQPVRQVRPAWLVIVLCWLIVVFDGYDLIVYGTTLPSILAEPGWGLTATTAGVIGSLAFLRMLVGALAAGRLADALGRRRTILWCTSWLSLVTVLCYVAPNAGTFGAFRFIAGFPPTTLADAAAGSASPLELGPPRALPDGLAHQEGCGPVTIADLLVGCCRVPQPG